MKIFWSSLLLLCILQLLLSETTFARQIPGSQLRKRTGGTRNIRLDTRDSALPLQPGIDGVNHLVKDLPDAPKYDGRHWAGYISINNTYQETVNLFYWLFESASSTPEVDPLIIWMNGGPYCSSFDGALLEFLSPFVISPDEGCPGLVANPNAWNKKANILFLDQPVGTGFSFGAELKSGGLDYAITEAAEQFRQFLINFLQFYPTFQNRPLYLMGESFAGQYIPFYSQYLLKHPAKGISLVGLGIGNGWIDPESHYTTYAEFEFSHGLISAGQKRQMEYEHQPCRDQLERLRNGTAWIVRSCNYLEDTGIDVTGPDGMTVVYYDIRLYGSSWTYPFPRQGCLEVYLNRTDVRSALHVEAFGQPENSPFFECSEQRHLNNRVYGTTKPQLISLLNSGIRVLLYSGQFDLICNHIGTSAILDSIKSDQVSWIDKFHSTAPTIWKTKADKDLYPNEDISGYVQHYANLTFLLFLGGGHMAPMDRPEAGLDMVNRFIQRQSFDDATPSKHIQPKKPNQAILGDCKPTIAVISPATRSPASTPTPSPSPVSSPTPSPDNSPTPSFSPTPTPQKPTPCRPADDDSSDSWDGSEEQEQVYHRASLFIIGFLSFVLGAAAMGFVLGIKYRMDQSRLQTAYAHMSAETPSTPF